MENVQAATEADQNVANTFVNSTVVSQAILTTLDIAKTYYTFGTAFDGSAIEKAVSDLDAPEGYSIVNATVNGTVGATTLTVTLLNETSKESVTSSRSFSLGAENVYVITAAKAASKWNPSITVDVSDVATPSEIEKAIRDVVENDYVGRLTTELGITYNGGASLDDFSVLVEKVKYDSESEKASVNFLIQNNKFSNDKETKTVEISLTESQSNVGKAVLALDKLNTLENKYGYKADDVKNTGDATTGLKEAVEKKATEIVNDESVVLDWDTKTVPHFDASTMTFTGTLKVSDKNNSAKYQTKTVTVKVDKLNTVTIKSVEVLGTIEDTVVTSEKPISDVKNISFKGVTIRVTDSTGKVIDIKGTNGATFEGDYNKYFTLDSSNLKAAIGSYNVKLVAKDADSTVINLPVNVYATDELGPKWYDGNRVLEATTSDENLEITNKKEIAAGTATTVDLKAKKAGSYTVTTVNDKGTTLATTVTVKENGQYEFEKAKINGTVYVENDDAVLGIVATKVTGITTTADPSSAKTDCVNAEIKNGKVVITANETGTAYVHLSGGQNNNLSSYIMVTVNSENDITVEANPEYAHIKSIEATEDLKNAISSHAIADYADVIEVCGLDENYLLKVVNYDGKEDVIPVTDAILKVKDGKVTITYGKVSTTVSCLKVVEITNDGRKLGLFATDVSVGKKTGDSSETGCTAEIRDGKIVITPKTGSYTKDIITVSDGNVSTTITLKVVDGRITDLDINKLTLTDVEFPAKLSKNTFKLGETVDFDTEKDFITYKKGGKTYSLPITSEMLFAGDKTFNTSKVSTTKYTVSIGGKTHTYTMTVAPTTEVLKNTDLGFKSDETIATITYNGQNKVIASRYGFDKSVKLEAQEINSKTSVIVTTNKGNSVTINVAVDANGNITTDYFAYGKSITLNNNVDTLGLIAKDLMVNGDAVKAELNGSLIKITGQKAGDATIIATDADGNEALISVNVDNKGNVVVKDIDKYLGYIPGWHAAENGGWYWVNEDGSIMQDGWLEDGGYRYYIVDGVTVYNSWKYFEEEGVWRYFNKWGANVENGWYWVGKFCYFFRDGQMVENEWIKTNGIWSYVDKYGHALQNGWFKIDGKYYCFDKYGNMYADTYVGKYYVNKWGAWDSRYDKK